MIFNGLEPLKMQFYKASHTLRLISCDFIYTYIDHKPLEKSPKNVATIIMQMGGLLTLNLAYS